MKSKASIPLKVLFGYMLLAGLVVFALWLLYPQIRTFIYPARQTQSANQKLTYISTALSLLYEAETLGRSAMATGNDAPLKQYKTLNERIFKQIDSLASMTEIPEQRRQLDSINDMLDQKTSNIETMVALRKQQLGRNFYEEALADLVKEDIYFEEYENSPVLDTMDDYKKKVLVDLMQYLRKDNVDTDNAMTSMAETVRKTLANIERRKKKIELDLKGKEEVLLANDRNISARIRNLLTFLERENTRSVAQRERALKTRIAEITRTLWIIGVTSIFLALAFVVSIFRDMSRRQRHNSQLEQSTATARSLLKSREQLMATITHDMRSPLNTIMGFTELLEQSGLQQTQENYLGQIGKSSTYMMRLVNDLLDFSKLEAGKLRLEEVPFHAKTLIEDSAVLALPSSIKKGLKIIMDVDPALDGYFISDPLRLKQILANLISNAYKFTHAGSLDIQARLLDKTEPKIIFTIKDTGMGIPKEKQELVFNEFAQADVQIEKTYGGFGLGLAITKRLVDLLNGSIDLKSVAGKGSTFKVTIPVKWALGDFGESKKKIYKASNETLPKHILIVDDEPSQRELVKTIVGNLNLKHSMATNGKEALKVLETSVVDLILTDIQMPIMDGIAFAKAVRHLPQYAKIQLFALSGHPDLNEQTYKELGFTGVLAKPYSPNSLRELILTGEVGPEINRAAIVPPTTAEFDLEEILLFTEDDPEALKAILNLFIESTATNLEALYKAVKTNKTVEINAISHRMLPMFRQLRAAYAIPILEILEHATVMKPTTIEMENLFQELEVVCKKICDGLLRNA